MDINLLRSVEHYADKAAEDISRIASLVSQQECDEIVGRMIMRFTASIAVERHRQCDQIVTRPEK